MELGLLLLASVIISAGGTWLNNRQQAKEAQKNRTWEEAMMDKQNEYNSDINVMQRKAEAGINPVAASMNEGSSPYTQSADVNSVATPQMQNIFGQIPQLLGSLTTGNLQNQQALWEMSSRELRLKQISDQNNLLNEQVTGMKLSNDAQRIVNNYIDAKEYWAVEGQKQQVKLTYDQRRKINADIKTAEFNLQEVLPQQVRESISREKVNYMNVDEIVAKIDSIKMDTLLTEQEIANYKAQLELTQSETLGQNLDNDMAAIELAYKADLCNAYLKKYEAEIKQITANSNLTEQQVNSFIFEKVFGIATSIAKLF